jgi:hypothetical protein
MAGLIEKIAHFQIGNSFVPVLVSGWALTILAEESHAQNTAGRGLFL